MFSVFNVMKRVGVFIAFVICSQSTFAEYFIGLNAGFTGAKEKSNRAYQYGVEAYLNKINTAGGVKGEKIILEVLDDGFQQAAASNNVQRLVTRKNVIALLGGSSSVTALSMYQAAAANKTLFVGPILGANELYDGRKFMLNTRPSLQQEAEFLAKHLSGLDVPAQEMALVGEIGGAELASLNTAFKAQFGEGAMIEYGYPENTLSVNGVVSRLLKSGRKHLVLTGSFSSVNQIMTNIRGASNTDDWHFYLLSSTDLDLLQTIATTTNNLKQVRYLPRMTSNQGLVQQYKTDLNSLNDSLIPSMKGLEGYLTAQILIKGIQEVVNPFEFDSPDDFVKLPFNVVRKFAGWVQRGSKDEVRFQLSDALSVMHTISVGLPRPVGFSEGRNYLAWELVID